MAVSFRKILEGLRIVPKTTSTSSETGDIEVLSSDGKVRLYNAAQATPNSPIVTEAHQATLTNKTLTSPVLNTPTADTITGIAGGALTVQSASNQNLSLQAQGTGVVQLESLSIDANTVTGGDSTLTIQSASSQSISIQAPFAPVQIENVAVQDNTISGSDSDQFTIRSGANQNLSLLAQGNGKIFLNSPVENRSTFALNVQTDAVTTGSNATVTTPSKSYIQLTNNSLASINGIPAGVDGQVVVLSNRTGNSVVINNETGATAGNRILTGAGIAVAVSNNASVQLIYNGSVSRWMVIGAVSGAGGGSVPNSTVLSISSNTILTTTTDVVLVNAGSGSVNVTLPSPTSGKIITVKKTDSSANSVSILPSASETIDGTSLAGIIGQYDAVQVISDGTNWFII